MERSQLSLGNVVAIYPTTPVLSDPDSHGYRENVRCQVVTDLTDGQVIVQSGAWVGMTPDERFIPEGNAEAVTPRQVIAKWDDWEANIADRLSRAHQQSDRAQRRVDEEARALGQAVATYPTARMEGHCIVIPVPDWLAVNDGRA